MNIIETKLPGVLLIEPQIFTDHRGTFFECYHRERYEQRGLPFNFVQDNLSRSRQGVLRGLHYQFPRAQGKLIWVTRGEIFDVAVDIRTNSPTFGQWIGHTLCGEKPQQVYIPPGFAHGFCVLSAEADFYYKCTDYYDPSSEHGILWNDPKLNIHWPIAEPILSSKDTLYPTLMQVSLEHLPCYQPNGQ